MKTTDNIYNRRTPDPDPGMFTYVVHAGFIMLVVVFEFEDCYDNARVRSGSFIYSKKIDR